MMAIMITKPPIHPTKLNFSWISIHENNAANIFSIKGINGFLIGTSSLDAKRFYDIYRQI